MAIQSFRDLECYRNALKAISATELIVVKFVLPQDNRLASQIRNAAHSVPSNIAEGFGHLEKESDFKRFMRIAMASANEVCARLDSASASNFIDLRTADELSASWIIVGKQLNKLIQNWHRHP